MTKDEIIKLAEQAGFSRTHSGGVQLWLCNKNDIERFASLVAEHEREACALACDDVGDFMLSQDYADAIRARSKE